MLLAISSAASSSGVLFICCLKPQEALESLVSWCWPYSTPTWEVPANENLFFEILMPLATVLLVSFHACQEGGCAAMVYSALPLQFPHLELLSLIMILGSLELGPPDLLFWVPGSYLFHLRVLKSFQCGRGSDQSFSRGML